MKRMTIILSCLLAVALSAEPAKALNWRAKSYVFPTEKPQGESSYVWTRGKHQVQILRVKLVDTIIPFRYRVKSGELRFQSSTEDMCASTWVWSWQEVFFKECPTYDIQAFCENGDWTAATTGELDFNPAAGFMFDITPPNMLHCACT